MDLQQLQNEISGANNNKTNFSGAKETVIVVSSEELLPEKWKQLEKESWKQMNFKWSEKMISSSIEVVKTSSNAPLSGGFDNNKSNETNF